MSEFRGEALHMCPRIILKCQKVKKLKTTIKLSKLIKMQLSLRGGVLETEMGQFFRKWVVEEGLLPDNYRPTGDEVLFYANSRQRTFATAKYFSAGFLPFANV